MNMIDVNIDKSTSSSNHLAENRDYSGDRAVHGTFAFGSSTPRILSYLCGTAREYSNDKINPQVGRRSYTTPTFPTSRSKTVASPLTIEMKRTNGIIQKLSGTEEKKITSKNTCRVQSINHQSRKGSEDFIKKKLQIQNDTAKSMKKVIAKEKQSKSEKTGIRKASVGKGFAKTEVPEESEKVSSVDYVGFENEKEKVLLFKKGEEVTLTDEIQLLNANTIENQAKMLPVKSTAAEKIITKETVESNSFRKTSSIDTLMENATIQILHEELEGEKIDINIQPGSNGRDGLTEDTFSIVSIKNHVNKNAKSNSEYKDETGQEFSINSGSEELSPFIGLYNTVSTAITTDPVTVKPSSSSVFEKSFNLPNDNGKLKDDIQLHCPKHSDEIKSREAVAKNSNDEQVDSELQQYRLSKIRESVPESLHQLQKNNSAAAGKQSLRVDADHEIIYNHNYEYYSGTPIRRDCVDAKKSDGKVFERENSFHK
ncbi:NAD(P)H-hydrate epimerase [Dirofilaria immitis]